MKLNALLALVMALLCHNLKSQELFETPKAQKKEHINILHGDTAIDNYHWMHNKYDVDFVNYLHAENAYADRKMKSSALLQKKIFVSYGID